MDNKAKISAIVLRLLMGWYMFFDGIPKVLDPNFSATGFLLNAKPFPGFYAWFASPMNAWWVGPFNAWAITLIGVALLLGVAVRLACWAGAAMMIIYYFPHYDLPAVTHGYVVEEHIIYAAIFAFIALFVPSQEFGLAGRLRKSFLGQVPVLKNLI